jgi:hypothetical protein
VAPPDQSIDLEEVIRVLVSMGIEEGRARAQFSASESDRDRLAEAAALAMESEAALVISDDMPLPVALFELVDGLRQAGLAVSVSTSSNGQYALAFAGARPIAYELHFDAAAKPKDLVQAVAYAVPRTHQLLLAVEYEQPDVVPIVILDRGSYMWFSAAVGDGALDRVFARAAASGERVRLKICEDGLRPPDFAARFRAHQPDVEAAQSVEAAFARLETYDPRVAWPIDRDRPPGDDFYDFCNALAAQPLVNCLANEDSRPLANLLYQFALATLVGAHCDLLAARRNPGRSVQGILGLGQLTWSYFIFEALDAGPEAQRAGRLLDDPWVRTQERGMVAARQRAYCDLAANLRHGARSLALGRLDELLGLRTREGWQDAEAVRAAVSVQSEPLGDQLTHHPLYHVWPAPLYALARRAFALDLLPRDNPFLARPLSFDEVDQQQPMVLRMHQQLAGFDALDPAHLPPVLDPLPVIVDVQITAVDAENAHGHTLLCAFDDAEHRVVAPHAGRGMQPGEVWLLEVQGSRPDSARAHYDDLGDVSCAIALPTGEWLDKV